MEPNVCNGCSGSGAIGRHVDENGNLVRDCASCNGTGKVWASVEGEMVQVRQVPIGQPMELSLMSVHGGVYRIIVQPLE